ncbi:sigma-E factor negative regulatory protein [Agaribacter marinus]|uniref:Anti-sigma-E factor RseA n=1 Tax=Agaribacter marinus TaxID=1431249 RepID=A0AA37T109_9ALTE|nr:RseA family anti-sigma factor [Agaribacter marinus]GLR73041.1 anti-sigma-E factor RseA [Agaribacter marinus]
MSKDFEQLSAMVDGQTDDVAIAKEMLNDHELQRKWKSYHLTRDLMRNDMSSDLSFDVSAKVAQALEKELPIVAPKSTWKELPVVSSVIPIFKQSSQVAMAACVTALVIFSYQSYNQPEEVQPFIAAPSAIGPMGGLSPVSLEQTSGVSQRSVAQLNEQRRLINALIEDHNRQTQLFQASLAEQQEGLEKVAKEEPAADSSSPE